MAIQGNVYIGVGGKAVSNDVAPATFRLRKIRSPFADPQYSADHGPLPHISASGVIQQKILQIGSTIST